MALKLHMTHKIISNDLCHCTVINYSSQFYYLGKS
jgi:hypothetical protein